MPRLDPKKLVNKINICFTDLTLDQLAYLGELTLENRSQIIRRLVDKEAKFQKSFEIAEAEDEKPKAA